MLDLHPRRVQLPIALPDHAPSFYILHFVGCSQTRPVNSGVHVSRTKCRTREVYCQSNEHSVALSLRILLRRRDGFAASLKTCGRAVRRGHCRNDRRISTRLWPSCNLDSSIGSSTSSGLSRPYTTTGLSNPHVSMHISPELQQYAECARAGSRRLASSSTSYRSALAPGSDQTNDRPLSIIGDLAPPAFYCDSQPWFHAIEMYDRNCARPQRVALSSIVRREQ